MIERRRVIMEEKGEHVDKWIQYLKSIGCQYYFPLNEGNLVDSINGEELVVTSDGSMTWETSAGMYKFTTPSSSGKYVASIPDGMNAISQSGVYTVIATMYVFERSDPSALFALGVQNPNSFLILSSKSGNIWSKNWQSSTADYGTIRNVSGSVLKVYINGSVSLNTTFSFTMPSAQDMLIASSMWPNDSNKRVHTGLSFYMKDLMIFDRQLTDSQIQKIYLHPQGDYVWVRLDWLKNKLSWNTSIINADNPVNTSSNFPIYAIAIDNSADGSTTSAGIIFYHSAPGDWEHDGRIWVNNKQLLYTDQAGSPVYPFTYCGSRGFAQENINVLGVGTVSNAWVYWSSDDSKLYSSDYGRGVMYWVRYQKYANLTKQYALIRVADIPD